MNQSSPPKISPQDAGIGAMLDALKQQRDATADAVVRQVGAHAELQAKYDELRAITEDMRKLAIETSEVALEAIVTADPGAKSDPVLRAAADKLRGMLVQFRLASDVVAS